MGEAKRRKLVASTAAANKWATVAPASFALKATKRQVPATLDEILNAAVRKGELSMSLVGRLLRNGQAFYASDLVLMGAGRRVHDHAVGFRAMVKSHNMTCAASILRMQLDTAMRLNARNLVSDPEAFCIAVIEQERIDLLQDKNGTPLRDWHLKNALASRFGWITDVYGETSGFVHFSGKHVFQGITSVDEETRSFSFTTGVRSDRTEKDYHEVGFAFEHATSVCLQLLSEWLQSTGRLAESDQIA
jgi:hypothetical protein